MAQHTATAPQLPSTLLEMHTSLKPSSSSSKPKMQFWHQQLPTAQEQIIAPTLTRVTTTLEVITMWLLSITEPMDPSRVRETSQIILCS
jgi:hypothetical protein